VGEAVQLGNAAATVIAVGEGQPVSPDEGEAGLAAVQQADADELHAAGFPLSVDALPPGGVTVARDSPRRPEKQDDPLAAQIG